MDLPRGDSSDYPGHLTSFTHESGYYTEDHMLRDFSFCYGRDMLEEDALNEKSCMQVLKIWIDKADEDIVKLEEDILMLQCQLVWDDEEWSKQCSATLREKIDHLDMLTESLKDGRENGLQTEELPPRLHDFLKPLLENYFAKSKQTETSIVQVPAPPVVELSNKKIARNASSIMLKTYERKSKSPEREERKLSLPQRKKDTNIRYFNASGDTCTNEVSEKVMNKPSTLEGRRMPNLVQVKLEPADPMVKELSASTSIEKAKSRENEEKRNNNNNNKKAISEAKVVQGRIRHEIKVDSMKPRIEASNKVQKARVYRHAIIENALSVKPLVKMKGKNTKNPQTPEAVMDDRTKRVKKPRIESEHQIQVQEKCKECQQILQKDKGVSSAENLIKQRKDGVLEGMSKNCEKETEQQLNNAPEVTATTILLPREVRKSSCSSQKTSKKRGPKSSLMKPAKVECDASNSTAEEATDGAKNAPPIPSPCNKSKVELTLASLRAIARSQKLRHYYRLRKEQLQMLLGFKGEKEYESKGFHL